MTTQLITLGVPEEELGELKLGEKISVTIMGTVKSLQSGVSPEDMEAWDKAMRAGDKEAKAWKPPSEIEIEASDVTITGSGKYASLTADDEEQE